MMLPECAINLTLSNGRQTVSVVLERGWRWDPVLGATQRRYRAVKDVNAVDDWIGYEVVWSEDAYTTSPFILTTNSSSGPPVLEVSYVGDDA